MTPNCVRCSRPGFATLELVAAIGATRLEINGAAKPAGICASCLLEFTAFFGTGELDPDPVPMPENAPIVRDRGGARV